MLPPPILNEVGPEVGETDLENKAEAAVIEMLEEIFQWTTIVSEATTEVVTEAPTTTTTEEAAKTLEIVGVEKDGDSLVLVWNNGVMMPVKMSQVSKCRFGGVLPWDAVSYLDQMGCDEDDFSVDIKSQVYGNYKLAVRKGTVHKVSAILDHVFTQ